MNVIQFVPERRRRRSMNAYQAVKFQLEHIVERRDLRNFVLGDSRGIMLAQAGHMQESEVLAAYAPLLAQCADRGRKTEIFDVIRSFIPDATQNSVQIRTFQIDGETLHLCVLGHAGVPHTDLYRATSGIRRILGDDEQQVA